MGQVTFRRIRGRIVPIKSENNHNVAKGSALIAAGGVAGYVAGKKSAALIHEAANKDNFAINTKKFMSDKINQFSHIKSNLLSDGLARESRTISRRAKMNTKKADILRRSSFRIRNIGHVVAAGLIASGTHRIISGKEMDESPKTKAAISAAAGVGSVFAVRSGYLRGVGVRGIRVVKLAARRAFLKI